MTTSIWPVDPKQIAFACGCGKTPIVARGLCASCYAMHIHDSNYFGGLREAVLRRDNYACRVCGQRNHDGARIILVHHRKPSVNHLNKMITLCRKCHAFVHKRTCLIDANTPEFLRVLWRELHPDAREQMPLDFTQCEEPPLLPFDVQHGGSDAVLPLAVCDNG